MPKPEYILNLLPRTVDGYACSEKEQQQQRVFHLWYQWVPIYFALSCILYVAPYFSKYTKLH